MHYLGRTRSLHCPSLTITGIYKICMPLSTRLVVFQENKWITCVVNVLIKSSVTAWIEGLELRWQKTFASSSKVEYLWWCTYICGYALINTTFGTSERNRTYLILWIFKNKRNEKQLMSTIKPKIRLYKNSVYVMKLLKFSLQQKVQWNQYKLLL